MAPLFGRVYLMLTVILEDSGSNESKMSVSKAYAELSEVPTDLNECVLVKLSVVTVKYEVAVALAATAYANRIFSSDFNSGNENV